MWPSAICCNWLRKHEYFQKSLLSFNRSHTGKKSYLGLITHESIHWVSYGGNDVGAFPQRHVIKL